ncbi:MAG: WD40 repeat domain-containing protein [Phycisphaerales bacterium]|nr:WD40 repeat domain-containing protein [Phycisphaerales bacterium]
MAGMSADGYVRIWNLRGGRGRREVGHSPGVVAWSPDGHQFATFGEDQRLVLYDAASEKPIWEQRVASPREWASDLAFSPDGRVLACSGASTDIEFRDVATGEIISAIYTHQGRAGRIAWSPNGRQLASLGTDQFLRVWEPETGTMLLELLVGTSEVVMGTLFAIAFSPDGRQVAASARDCAIRVWNVDDGQLLHTLTGHEDTIGGLCYTSSGDRIISNSLDGTVRVWDLHSGAGLQTMRGARFRLRHLALAPDDRHLFSAGDDLRLWDIHTGRQVLKLTDQSCFRIALSPDGKRLLGCLEGGTIVIWDGSPLP